MNFFQLQDNLRKLLKDRIENGQLTGLALARQAGFKQAHISNFLNCKRSLSQVGLDKVLATQQLSIFDLLGPSDVNLQVSLPPVGEHGFETVPLVDSAIAASQPVICREHRRNQHKFQSALLRRIRPDEAPVHAAWTRFVLIRVGGEAMSMYPRITPGAVLLIDRHYTSSAPYRRGQPNIYAVRKDGQCAIAYLEYNCHCLILRPHNPGYPVDLVPVDVGQDFHEHIVGRICQIMAEC
jgi:hypothetical protein